MIYVRGQPEDFDHWAQLGNRGWSWEGVLPFFSRRRTGRAARTRCTPRAARCSPPPRRQAVAVPGSIEAGTADRPGISRGRQQPAARRRRQYRLGAADAARTAPAERGAHLSARRRKRPNLQVVTNALVRRVPLDGKRATGVEYSRSGSVETASAAREVICLAARSARRMCCNCRASAIPNISAASALRWCTRCRGVGKNLQDHFLARVHRRDHGRADRQREVARPAVDGRADALCVRRAGAVDLRGVTGGASVKVLEESRPRTCNVFRQCQLCAGAGPQAGYKPGMTGGMWQMRPLSRGYVEANRPRPDGPAGDQPALPQRRGRPALRRSAACARCAVVRRAGAGEILVAETLPGNDVQTRRRVAGLRAADRLDRVPRDLHLQDGPDAMAVVDDRLRVHGIEGLRVIDASVMPTVTSTNTNAPTMMIAEKGAAMILDDARRATAIRYAGDDRHDGGYRRRLPGLAPVMAERPAAGAASCSGLTGPDDCRVMAGGLGTSVGRGPYDPLDRRLSWTTRATGSVARA